MLVLGKTLSITLVGSWPGGHVKFLRGENPMPRGEVADVSIDVDVKPLTLIRTSW